MKISYRLMTISTLPYENHNLSFTMIVIYQNCTFFLGNHEIICHPGNVMLVKSGTFLTVKENNKNQLTKKWFLMYEFEPCFFDDYLSAQLISYPFFYSLIRSQPSEDSHYLFFDTSKKSMIHPYLKILQRECCYTSISDLKMVQCAFLLIIKNLERIQTDHLIISESSMMPDYMIGQLLSYMTTNYRTVTLSSLANTFNFHPSYLSYFFKSKVGMTFSEKLLLIKLEKAKRLLLTTNLTVQEIVDLIGFKEKSYFYKRFQQFYGLTPAKYRKEYHY